MSANMRHFSRSDYPSDREKPWRSFSFSPSFVSPRCPITPVVSEISSEISFVRFHDHDQQTSLPFLRPCYGILCHLCPWPGERMCRSMDECEQQSRKKNVEQAKFVGKETPSFPHPSPSPAVPIFSKRSRCLKERDHGPLYKRVIT